MVKVKKYEKAILSFLEDYAQGFAPDEANVETQLMADKERRHYQLLRVGWRNNKRFIHLCLFHFDIKNGKVWIQKNETEELVGDELIKRGVPKNDIILGFQPEYVRPYSGFAVALGREVNKVLSWPLFKGGL